MITEAILIVFAIVYYLFGVFFLATVVQDINEKHTVLQILGMVLMLMIIAPTVTPIILGIELGDWVKNN